MSEKQPRLLVKEQPHQLRAFEYYYSLGEHRNYEKVAAEFGVATSTVKLWGKSFGWRSRVRERDMQVVREVASRTLDSEVSRREQSLQIVRMAVFQLAKAIAEGQVKMTLADLDRLIRLEAFLSDEPDSRQEIVIGDIRGKTDEELRRMVREELGMLKELDEGLAEALETQEEDPLTGTKP